MWQRSPLAYVNQVKTPLLLIHTAEDLRCPMEQAGQFYTAIKRHGGEVELSRVPQATPGAVPSWPAEAPACPPSGPRRMD